MTDALRETLQKSLGVSYAMERELGGGGMSTIYFAHDLRHHRDVAIKVLRRALDNRSTLDILDTVRRKRIEINCELAGSTSSSEAGKLFALVIDLREMASSWLADRHPELFARSDHR